MPDQVLRLDHQADRVVATIDRPEVRNAIGQNLVDELHALCAELETTPKLLILTGANGIFASGADIAELRERTRDDALAGINLRLFDRIAALPLPVIAAVDGPALGGGAELAYAADFRIATTTARFGNPEVGLGIIAGAGATWRLPELVGASLAREILLAGRILDADEALAAGLVGSVHPSDELLPTAHALADRILTGSAAALMATKRALAAPRDAHPRIDLDEQAVLFDSDDKRARMTAFLERRRTRAKTERSAP